MFRFLFHILCVKNKNEIAREREIWNKQFITVPFLITNPIIV